MKIAYVCADPGVPVFGRKGCSIHVQEILRALLASNVSVQLFASNVKGDRAGDLSGVDVHELPAPSRLSSSEREQSCLKANFDLQDLLEQAGPFDIIYERYSLWSYAGMEFAKRAGIPGILEVNAPLIQEQIDFRELIDVKSAEEVRNRAFNSASALVGVSKEIVQYLKAFSLNGKVHLIPNAVNPDRFREMSSSRLDDKKHFTVGFVGSLKPWHGLQFLIEAFAILQTKSKDIRLLIVGEGPERENLEREICSRGLKESVELAGPVDPEKIPGFLATMNIATAPYPAMKNFYFSPLKVYEYMMAARPVVASGIGQLAEIIQDEVNGLLCIPSDAISLAAAIERLWKDPEERTRLGAEARRTMLHGHTWKDNIRRILEIGGIIVSEVHI